MGPATDDQSGSSRQLGLFDETVRLGTKKRVASSVLATSSIPKTVLLPPPHQTSFKSKLIAAYLRRFLMVTQGGVYIDGFAAPQSRQHPEAWTARRVLEIYELRFRVCWLCDIDPLGLVQLRDLAAKHHQGRGGRRVFVMPGDFNDTIKIILKSPRISQRTAVFALLDQRMAECHWKTVQAIAAREGRHKIEVMYFIGTSWLHRSINAASTDRRLDELDRWWGGAWLGRPQRPISRQCGRYRCAAFYRRVQLQARSFSPCAAKLGRHEDLLSPDTRKRPRRGTKAHGICLSGRNWLDHRVCG